MTRKPNVNKIKLHTEERIENNPSYYNLKDNCIHNYNDHDHHKAFCTLVEELLCQQEIAGPNRCLIRRRRADHYSESRADFKLKD